MTARHPFLNTTDSPLPLGEGLGRRVELVETVRSNLTKRQIEVMMFACGIEKLEGLTVGKLLELK